MINIAVLVSGGGTNLQALLEAEKGNKIPHGRITLVVSGKENAYALKRAENFGKESITLRRKDYASQEAYDTALLAILKAHAIDMVVLAGFLNILGKKFIDTYPDRIINVHPSLIPAFCGAGYYGLKVHEEALKRGVKVSGATVHLVNEIPDGGRILLQKAVEVMTDDTPETLQKRIMEQAEWILLPKAAAMLAEIIDKNKEKNA